MWSSAGACCVDRRRSLSPAGTPLSQTADGKTTRASTSSRGSVSGRPSVRSWLLSWDEIDQPGGRPWSGRTDSPAGLIQAVLVARRRPSLSHRPIRRLDPSAIADEPCSWSTWAQPGADSVLGAPVLLLPLLLLLLLLLLYIVLSKVWLQRHHLSGVKSVEEGDRISPFGGLLTPGFVNGSWRTTDTSPNSRRPSVFFLLRWRKPGTVYRLKWRHQRHCRHLKLKVTIYTFISRHVISAFPPRIVVKLMQRSAVLMSYVMWFRHRRHRVCN